MYLEWLDCFIYGENAEIYEENAETHECFSFCEFETQGSQATAPGQSEHACGTPYE